MKSFLVVGLGHFGKYLASRLLELGNEVMVVDKNEEVIEALDAVFTDSFVGDCRIEGVARSLGVNNFDVCFVAVDRDFQSSLEITAMLKELGAKYVVSTANRDRQAIFLKKIGADEVIFPEREIAEKAAVKYNANHIFDYIQLNDEYSIYEIPIPTEWNGKSIHDVNVRRNYGVNIVAVKHSDESLNPLPGAAYILDSNDHLIVIGDEESVEKITKLD